MNPNLPYHLAAFGCTAYASWVSWGCYRRLLEMTAKIHSCIQHCPVCQGDGVLPGTLHPGEIGAPCMWCYPLRNLVTK